MAHRITPLDDEPMPWKEPISAQARHPLQCVGPLDGVALHFLRVAAIGRPPEDEVTREEIAALGDPDVAMVVGLTFGRSVSDLELSHPLGERVAKRQRRVLEIAREEDVAAELPTVDRSIEALG